MSYKSIISKKRQVVADGVFYAELNEFFESELAKQGYAGTEIKRDKNKTIIIIKCGSTSDVIGESGQRIQELTSLVQKRFGFADDEITIACDRIANKGLCAQTQAESLKFKLLDGIQVRRACSGVLRFIMEKGAKGCEVSVSGKVRGQRAKTQKFSQGYMIKTGHAYDEYVEEAVRHVMMRQGILGVKVAIMMPYDPTGVNGVKTPLSDVITVLEPKTV
jgi:small subunit ribosomal protein S3e